MNSDLFKINILWNCDDPCFSFKQEKNKTNAIIKKKSCDLAKYSICNNLTVHALTLSKAGA